MANDFTVAELLDWARTKPAEQRYCYSDTGHCALARFLLDTGRAREPGVGGFTWCDFALPGHSYHTIPADIRDAVFAKGAIELHTFGHLVKRLEQIVQETPIAPTLWTNPQTYLDADCGSVSA